MLRKIMLISMLVVSFVIANITIVSASELDNLILNISSSKMGYSGLKTVNFYLNGDILQLNTSQVYHSSSYINGGYINLVDPSNNAVYMSFPIESGPYFKANKITSVAGGEYLLIHSGRCGGSDDVCTGLWLIGKYKGNYACFANLDALRNSGLIFSHIEANVVNGEIQILGETRDRNCRDGYYNGHSVRPGNGPYRTINEARLFWDANAQWFGIRIID